MIVRLSDVQPEPVAWLWPGRIALGKLTLIAGDPGLGKSFLTLDMAARVSTGAGWPDRPPSRELAPHPSDPARLRHRRPTPHGWAADLPPDLSARLRLHRGAVLGLLSPHGGYAPDPHGDAGYVYGERLGIADGLGMPTHPGSPAWMVAVGESMHAGHSRGANIDAIHTVCYTKA